MATSPSASGRVSQRLREARTAAGLTCADLGAKVGVSGATISRYETGDREPMLDTFSALARALGVPLAHLLCVDAVDGDGVYDAGFHDGWRACAEAVSRATSQPAPTNGDT